MKEDYDSSWGLVENDDGNLPDDKEAFEKKYAEWEKRKWSKWLKKNLTFPFTVMGKKDGIN